MCPSSNAINPLMGIDMIQQRINKPYKQANMIGRESYLHNSVKYSPCQRMERKCLKGALALNEVSMLGYVPKS